MMERLRVEATLEEKNMDVRRRLFRVVGSIVSQREKVAGGGRGRMRGLRKWGKGKYHS